MNENRFTDGGLELEHEAIKMKCVIKSVGDEVAYNYTLRECNNKGVIDPKGKPHLKLIQ